MLDQISQIITDYKDSALRIEEGPTTCVSMPSNIALIKYMGKTQYQLNQASNASLSITVPYLRSYVRLTPIDESQDRWSPLVWPGTEALNLSSKGQLRFLNFLNLLKTQWGLTNNYLIESANSFPSDCGVASSSSSFAALTMAVFCQAVKEKRITQAISLNDLANLSQRGSGSSCRSLFTGAALWDGDHVIRQDLAALNGGLYHQVYLVETEIKKVSSSEAHQRVNSSLLFSDRTNRVRDRLQALLMGLGSSSNWAQCYQLVWSEFWDMHALFETSQPSFGYLTADSLRVLEQVRSFWETVQDGPLVTMDAGPNVHLFWRADQQALREQWQQKFHLYLKYSTLAGEA